MEHIEKLLLQNRAWVEQKTLEDAEYFKRSSKGQKPRFLWIGCSDSRVPANEVTATEPGEIFVIRNIANMVVHTDMSMLSVLDYAVNVLEVPHVIVCGHYGCGGVKASMSQKQLGLIDNWIRHIKDVYSIHSRELEAIKDPEQRENRFTELNVIDQVYNLTQTSIIQNAWSTRHAPFVHGWVYDLQTGLIKDLNVSMNDNSTLMEVYKFETP